MNMGDNVASATLQVGGKVVEIGGHLATKTIDLIAKLLESLIAKAKADRANKAVKARDLKDLKPGIVSAKKLKQSAMRTGDQVVFSQQGLTKADKTYIAAKAKKFGIPVAFTQGDGKDNIFAQVRKSDLPVFQQICTDMMKDKIAERPQTLGNFKINEWEMPFITNELNEYDLSASFGVTQDGQQFCMYEKTDEKAILIARGEFRRKCAEIESDLKFEKSEDGFYTVTSANSKEKLTFDELPSRDELAAQMQQKFGYDENKAQIACAKFGEVMLGAEEKTQFFSENPQNEFSNISGYISVEGEDIRCKAYTCWRVTPKTDEVPRIVFRDTDGNFAVLEPEKMSAKQMQDTLRESLGIEDAATLTALTDKAQAVSDYYLGQENMTLDADFDKGSFDMTDPAVVEGMRRTDADGHVYTKSQPVDSAHNEIERTGKDTFSVKSSVNSTELDEAGTAYRSTDTRELVLSFSDKKNAISELKEMYKAQGMSEEKARGYFRQTEDIVFPDWENHTSIDTVNELKADPDAEHFEYDGGGFTISNLQAPLFGKISGALIQNVNVTNSVITTEEYNNYGFICSAVYNYRYKTEDEAQYETGETIIRHCSVSHSAIYMQYPQTEETTEEVQVITAPTEVPPDLIEYDENGNPIETQDATEPIAPEPSKSAEFAVGSITGLGGQIENCYVNDFGIYANLDDYILYAGGLSGKPANVVDSAVFLFSAEGNIFYGGGICGSIGGAKYHNAAGRELPQCYGGSVQGCTARQIFLTAEAAGGGIAGEASTDAEGAMIANCYTNTLNMTVGIYDDTNLIKQGAVGGIIGMDGNEKNGHLITGCVSPVDFAVIGQQSLSRYDDTVRLAPAYAFYQENILSVINRNTVLPDAPGEIFTGSFKFGDAAVYGDESGALPYPAAIEDLFAKTITEGTDNG